MKQKLVQKSLLHGTQVFELGDEFVKVKISSRLHGEKELDVELAMINPEPVISKTRLEFHSRVKCRPLLSLYRDKPNAKEFSDFVGTIKEKARAQYAAFAGLSR